MSGLDWSAPFEELEIGSGFLSRGRTITEADIVGFAALTGDGHPQHTDAEWAAASRFGERIAHGMLVVSYAVGLLPLEPARVLALRRISDAVFKRPAKIGDTIHVNGRISTLKDVTPQAGLVGWRWEICAASELLLCRATVELLWAKRDVPPAAVFPSADPIDLPRGVIPC